MPGRGVVRFASCSRAPGDSGVPPPASHLPALPRVTSPVLELWDGGRGELEEQLLVNYEPGMGWATGTIKATLVLLWCVWHFPPPEKEDDYSLFTSSAWYPLLDQDRPKLGLYALWGCFQGSRCWVGVRSSDCWRPRHKPFLLGVSKAERLTRVQGWTVS